MKLAFVYNLYLGISVALCVLEQTKDDAGNVVWEEGTYRNRNEVPMPPESRWQKKHKRSVDVDEEDSDSNGPLISPSSATKKSFIRTHFSLPLGVALPLSYSQKIQQGKKSNVARVTLEDRLTDSSDERFAKIHYSHPSYSRSNVPKTWGMTWKNPGYGKEALQEENATGRSHLDAPYKITEEDLESGLMGRGLGGIKERAQNENLMEQKFEEKESAEDQDSMKRKKRNIIFLPHYHHYHYHRQRQPPPRKRKNGYYNHPPHLSSSSSKSSKSSSSSSTSSSSSSQSSSGSQSYSQSNLQPASNSQSNGTVAERPLNPLPGYNSQFLQSNSTPASGLQSDLLLAQSISMLPKNNQSDLLANFSNTRFHNISLFAQVESNNTEIQPNDRPKIFDDFKNYPQELNHSDVTNFLSQNKVNFHENQSGLGLALSNQSNLGLRPINQSNQTLLLSHHVIESVIPDIQAGQISLNRGQSSHNLLPNIQWDGGFRHDNQTKQHDKGVERQFQPPANSMGASRLGSGLVTNGTHENGDYEYVPQYGDPPDYEFDQRFPFQVDGLATQYETHNPHHNTPQEHLNSPYKMHDPHDDYKNVHPGHPFEDRNISGQEPLVLRLPNTLSKTTPSSNKRFKVALKQPEDKGREVTGIHRSDVPSSTEKTRKTIRDALRWVFFNGGKIIGRYQDDDRSPAELINK